MNCSFFFFFNDTATTEIYTLSLHDALPISPTAPPRSGSSRPPIRFWPTSSPSLPPSSARGTTDRKSTRLNSSHSQISYAVFCLKKKKHNSPSNHPHRMSFQPPHISMTRRPC